MQVSHAPLPRLFLYFALSPTDTLVFPCHTLQDYLSKPLRSVELVKLLREYVLPAFQHQQSASSLLGNGGTSSNGSSTP